MVFALSALITTRDITLKIANGLLEKNKLKIDGTLALLQLLVKRCLYRNGVKKLDCLITQFI